MVIEEIAGIIVGIPVGLGLVGLLLPKRWRVARSQTIDAPPSAIFPLVNDFERGWPSWNPWAKPGMKIAYEGAREGVGCISKWEHGRQKGRNEIIESDPATGIRFLFEMNDGFRAEARIAFERDGAATRVTWSSQGDIANPFFRWFGLLFLDRMIGRDYEKGLAAIRRLAEKSPAPAA